MFKTVTCIENSSINIWEKCREFTDIFVFELQPNNKIDFD